MDTLKKAIEAWKKMTAEEREIFALFLDKESDEEAKPARGHDARGRYSCGKCRKVLPTKRGRGIHQSKCDGTGAESAQ
jgi:hypothetical protein